LDTLPDEIGFIAPVANVDSSILKLSLKNGFNFTQLDQQAAQNLLALGEMSIPWSAGRKFFLDYPFLNFQDKWVYFVQTAFQVQPLTEGQEFWSVRFAEIARFENQYVKSYLFPTIRKLKLIAKGNPDAPFWYYFGVRDGKPSMLSGGARGGVPTSRDLMHLSDEQIQGAPTFFDKVELPFARSYLELAFENYELAYQAPSDSLAFVTLVTSLETLLVQGSSELSY
jgi:hypothetical protein